MQGKKQNYIDSAVKTINSGIEGLRSIIEVLNDDYIKIIDMILNCKGRVILSGMGKSGHVANKIAATLASTGTPSFAIHPGEASHGDLGMITADDIVILLSNSGETKELSDILFYCKRFSIPIVSFVRNADSQLVRASEVPLVLSKAPEANEVNAPTTSTTMMMALGDAIAVSLLEARGFNSESFGVFHPGGKLGAAFIRVQDIMRVVKDTPLVNENLNMREVLLEITSKHIGCTGVVDDSNKLIGIITDGDLRRHLEEGFLNQSAVEIMTPAPMEIDPQMLAVEAVALMNKKSITSLFVVEEGRVVGVLHIHDCLRSGVV